MLEARVWKYEKTSLNTQLAIAENTDGTYSIDASETFPVGSRILTNVSHIGLSIEEEADIPPRPPHSACPFHRRNSSAFVTTLTLENAIAAPAITGFNQPSAASGTPTRL